MTEVEVFGRLNFGLWDLSRNPFRVDGSTGMYTNLKIGKVVLKKNNSFFLNLQCDNQERIINVINRCIKKIGNNNFSIEIKAYFNSHIGLGSGTQLSLAIVASFDKEFCLHLSLNEMAILAGSGGTSCVGIYSFFYGGFIVDSGRKYPSEKSKIGPGEIFSFPKVSPMLLRIEVPEWYICLAIPKISKRVYSEYETNLFDSYTPLNDSDVNELCKWILTGLLPSLKTEDFESFCYCLEKCSNLGFKKREIETYEKFVKKCLSLLKQNNVNGVGMSSFGPSIYGFYSSKDEAIKSYNKLKKLDFFDKVILSTPRNSGAKIHYSDLDK